jgi:hypothetical protein
MSSDDPFTSFTEKLAEQLPELERTLLGDVNRAGEARDLVSGSLSVGKTADEAPEVTNTYRDAKAAQAALLGRILDIYVTGAVPITEVVTTQGKTVPPTISLSPEAEATFQGIRAAHFGMSTAYFFHFALVTEVHIAIAQYINVCEDFWGQRIGSHSYVKRFFQILKEVGFAAPGLWVPPPLSYPVMFLRAGWEFGVQWRNTPKKKTFDQLTQTRAVMSRVYKLKSSATTLSDTMDHVEAMVRSSKAAVEGYSELFRFMRDQS